MQWQKTVTRKIHNVIFNVICLLVFALLGLVFPDWGKCTCIAYHCFLSNINTVFFLTLHSSSLHSPFLVCTDYAATDSSLLSSCDDSLGPWSTAVILINWHSGNDFFSYDITLSQSDNRKLSQCDHQLIILDWYIFTHTLCTLKPTFSLPSYVCFLVLACFFLPCVTL